MPDLADGETTTMQGSAAEPYVLKNTGGVYSCSCPAWRNQSTPIERRTCKHLRKLRGDAAETERCGAALSGKPVRAAKPKIEGVEGAEGGDDDEAAAGPPLLLAHTWSNDVDLTGWWMSEKLDGVRAYWDGKQFISRQGNLFHAPDWFVKGLPSTPLDGELWLARKSFQRTVSIVRRQDKSDHWRDLRYVVFDAPTINEPFEQRVEAIKDLLGQSAHEFVRAHDHERCQSLAHLREELARLDALGAEGLMLRQPGSRYMAGRNSTLLKVKSFYDAEARVLEHQAGTGRHKGRMGALVVQLADGTKFKVGTGFSDAERNAPPAIGSLITFRYQELSDGGVPRFPSYVGLRTEGAASTLGAATARPVGVEKPSAAKASPVQAAKSAKKQPPPPVDDEDDEEDEEEAPPKKSGGGSAGGGAPRYFEFVEGTSSKFWEISLDGNEVTTRWGRIGTDGQSKTKSFANEAAAAKFAAGLIDEKTEKGYEEQEPE